MSTTDLDAQRHGNVAAQLRKQRFVFHLLEGYNLKECAKLMGVSIYSVYKWVKDPRVREMLQEQNSKLLEDLDVTLVKLQKTKLERIDEMSERALERMEELLESQNENLVFKVAQDTLDRDPATSRQKKLDVTQKTLKLEGEELLRAAQVMREVKEGKALEEARRIAGEELDDGDSRATA